MGRVVDRDRAPAEEVNLPVARIYAQSHRVLSVREAARTETGQEAGTGDLDAGEGRERFHDVDACQIQHEIVLILIIDVELDLTDGGLIERPALHENHPGLRDRGIRFLDITDE